MIPELQRRQDRAVGDEVTTGHGGGPKPDDKGGCPPTNVLPGDPTETDSFPPQWGSITSDAIRNVECCSRRSGKTEGKIRRAHRFVGRGKNVLYVGRILKNVRQQLWQPFKDRLSRHGVPYKTQEQDLVLRPEGGGGMLMGMSCDDIKDIEKGRGYRWDLAIIDEGQSFHDNVIEALVDYVIIPTLIDTGGILDVTGTPPKHDDGDVMDGYFVRLVKHAADNPSTDPRKGWRLHHWTMFENPFIKKENIYEAYAARGIGPKHPIWEAEVMGRIVENPALRVFPWDEGRNGYEAIA